MGAYSIVNTVKNGDTNEETEETFFLSNNRFSSNMDSSTNVLEENPAQD